MCFIQMYGSYIIHIRKFHIHKCSMLINQRIVKNTHSVIVSNLQIRLQFKIKWNQQEQNQSKTDWNNENCTILQMTFQSFDIFSLLSFSHFVQLNKTAVSIPIWCRTLLRVCVCVCAWNENIKQTECKKITLYS